jgi:hypothetical protein
VATLTRTARPSIQMGLVRQDAEPARWVAIGALAPSDGGRVCGHDRREVISLRRTSGGMRWRRRFVH